MTKKKKIEKTDEQTIHYRCFRCKSEKYCPLCKRRKGLIRNFKVFATQDLTIPPDLRHTHKIYMKKLNRSMLNKGEDQEKIT